jgi:lipopolysaccharide transport system permease protein
MPISTALSNLIAFFIQLVMFLVIWLVYLALGTTTMVPSWHMFLLPLLILQLMMLSTGCGIIISALTTKYRDLAMLVSFGLQLWQYASPIAYGLTLVSNSGKAYLFSLYMLNPMTPILTTFRYAFFGTGYFDVGVYITSWITTIVILFVGLILFNRIERTFMDTI